MANEPDVPRDNQQTPEEERKPTKPTKPAEDIEEQQKTVKTFIGVLKSEIREWDWKELSYLIREVEFLSFEARIKLLIQEGTLAKDLGEFTRVMRVINRKDIEAKITQHRAYFSEISDFVFVTLLLNEVSEIEKWKAILKEFISSKHEMVTQLVDEDKSVKMDSVYVPLTTVEKKTRDVKEEDETDLKELELLREITREGKGKTLELAEELEKIEESKPQIWCLIGNPGCGKNFLFHKTALRFGRGELTRFSYALSIQCSDPFWQYMEFNKNHVIDDAFIQQWLKLSMPIHNWTPYMTNYIVETEGDGLLLILDSMDDFVDVVGAAFRQTLLFRLLTRTSLPRSTILVSTRPGAYLELISSHPELKIDGCLQVLGFSPENRHLYFRKQIKEEEKVTQLLSLFEQSDEMDKLSLVPVNASLFAALVRESQVLNAVTLSQLYSELMAYLIRKQMARMGLERMEKRKVLFHLQPIVLDYLSRIKNVVNKERMDIS